MSLVSRSRFYCASLLWGVSHLFFALIVGTLLTGTTVHARAMESAAPSSTTPWAIGVSPDRQRVAVALLLEGNELFWDSSFKQAAEKYRTALRAWDHPMIHYNLALALSNLDNPIEVHRHLLAALKYGGEPLEEEFQRDARRRLGASLIAELDVSCSEPGAVVWVDDKRSLVGPSRSTELLLPGAHRILVKKPGFLSRRYELQLGAGARQTLETRIYTAGQLVEVSRPMSFWIPVTTAAAGASLLIVGTVLNDRSIALINQVQSYVDNTAHCAHGCPDPSDHRRESDRLKTASTVAYLVGGVTLTAGALGIWFNRARERRFTPQERDRQAGFAPLLGTNVWGAAAYGTF
ncbi:MAG TPA: hypothetical protein VKP30_01925 [Polyangiaceae bacterium]|nr:hypothetical protein [Polyangiaceae bacterium]